MPTGVLTPFKLANSNTKNLSLVASNVHYSFKNIIIDIIIVTIRITTVSIVILFFCIKIAEYACNSVLSLQGDE